MKVTVTMKKQHEPKAMATPTVTMTTATKKQPDPLCQRDSVARPQSVSDAEATLQSLQAKRAELQAAAAELAEAKRAASFAAHTSGSHELVNVTRAVRANDSDLESIGYAIAEGERRLLLAKAHEADRADRAKAARILELTVALKEAGQKMDDACRTLGETGKLLSGLLMELHGIGVRSPTLEQWQVHGGAALQTAVAGTPWAKNYRPLAPHERKMFGSLISGWAASIESRIRIPKREEIAA